MGSKPLEVGGVSVIMPAYNTAGEILNRIFGVEEAIGVLTSDYEVMALDDGSTDGTGAIAKDCLKSNPRLRLISYRENVGKGYALRLGFKEATRETGVFYRLKIIKWYQKNMNNKDARYRPVIPI
ncbi:MAG: glycosyltransferase [Candidatus Bathyarchaeia archaeon]